MTRKRDVVRFDAPEKFRAHPDPDDDDERVSIEDLIVGGLERRLEARLHQITRDYVTARVSELERAIDGDGGKAAVEPNLFKEGRMTYEQLIEKAQQDYDEIGKRERQTCNFTEFFEINKTLYEAELGSAPKLKFGEETTRSDANEAFVELRRNHHLHDDDEKLFTQLFNEEITHA